MKTTNTIRCLARPPKQTRTNTNLGIHVFGIHVQASIRQWERTTPGSISIGFTNKPESFSQFAQYPLVLDPPVNSSHFRIHLYWIHVPTRIRQWGRATSGSICIGFTYKSEIRQWRQATSGTICIRFTYKHAPGSEDEQPQVTSRQVTSRHVRSRHPPKWTDPDLARKAPKSIHFSKQL